MNESKNGRCACAKTDETIGSRSICSPIVPSRCSLETFQLSFPRATAILFKSSLHYCFPPPLVPTSHLSDSIPPSRRSESIFRFFHYGDCRFLRFIGEFWRTDLEYLGFFLYLFVWYRFRCHNDGFLSIAKGNPGLKNVERYVFKVEFVELKYSFKNIK